MTPSTTQNWVVDPCVQSTLPTPALFIDPLIFILGFLTGFKAEAPVKLKNAVRFTLHVCGLTPNNLPNGWTWKQLSIKVELAYRSRRPEYSTRPLTVTGPGGLWALNDEGLEQALKLRDLYKPAAERAHKLFLPLRKQVLDRIGVQVDYQAQFFSTSNLGVGSGSLQTVLDAFISKELVVKTSKGHKLTTKGCDIARKRAGFMPPPRTFKPLVLQALNKRTKGRAGVFVPMSGIILKVLRKAGYNPSALPHGWTLKGDFGLSRRVELAYRALRYQRNPLALTGDNGQWALSHQGTIEANLGNETSCWIQEQGPRLLRYLAAQITKAYPKSVQLGLVEEHLQNFFLKVIRRDSFAKHLKRTNGYLRYSKVASWCLNSCKSDFRGWGTKPLMREKCSARTKTEMNNFSEGTYEENFRWGRTFRDYSVLVFEVGKNEKHRIDGGIGSQTGQASFTDVVDPRDFTNPAVALGGNMTFDNTMNSLKAMVRGTPPKSWERYFRLITYRAIGHSLKEIAELEGIQPHQVTKLLSQARITIQSRLSDEVMDTATQTFRCRRDSGSSLAI